MNAAQAGYLFAAFGVALAVGYIAIGLMWISKDIRKSPYIPYGIGGALAVLIPFLGGFEELDFIAAFFVGAFFYWRYLSITKTP